MTGGQAMGDAPLPGVSGMDDRPSASLERSVQTAGSPYFAGLIAGTRATSRREIDGLLSTLQARKDDWARLAISERLSILREIRRDLLGVQERWVEAEFRAKAVAPGSLGEAEEWVVLATVFRAIRTCEMSLSEIMAEGRPRVPGPLARKSDGQVVAPVFPRTMAERLLFRGVSAEVWMEPGVTVEEVAATQAAAYRREGPRGRVALVLGAGNASMLPVVDLLHKLFVELQVVALKLNPVNAHMGPLMEEGFRALVERGFLGFAYGGADEGAYLCEHPAVDELHLTGSDKTYEAIVFGLGSEAARRKAERDPRVRKRFTGELGNVSPVIVVPGSWRQSDIEEQSVQIASWLVANAGFACLTPRVVVQQKSWRQRDQLTGAIGQWLDRVPSRMAYYPGAEDRHAEYVTAHPEAFRFGEAREGHLPWTLIADVDSTAANDICFKREAFCGLLAETGIEASDVPSFIDRAVEFANQTLWGTLSATIVVHPRSLDDPEIASAVERAIGGLRYGTVSLNMLAYYSAYFMTSPWGAFPGHDIYDIQSGIGKTFNFLMFERPQKSVVRAPFRRLDPLTVRAKRAAGFARRLAEFEASPSPWKLPGLGLAALRS